jgi:hypothetical protein
VRITNAVRWNFRSSSAFFGTQWGDQYIVLHSIGLIGLVGFDAKATDRPWPIFFSHLSPQLPWSAAWEIADYIDGHWLRTSHGGGAL